jgi:histidinol phosphatase-like enzyme (inositol monophosphatase family)
MTVPSVTERDELWSVARALADAARAAILPYFRTTDLAIDNKGDGGFDPVTAADRAAEKAMREVLAGRRPGDGVLGEEFGAREGTSGLTWVLDPIDGTRAFLSGTPTWGVLIALSDASGPILGIVDQPYIGERFFGGFGEAWLEGPQGRRQLAACGPRPLGQAILFTTFPEVGTGAEEAAFRQLSDKVRLTRYGMDCYAYALIAAGQVDLVVEAGLSAYDIHAPMAVIEAAGGVVTDWKGGPAKDGGRVLAAANRDIHAAALAVLSKAE